MPMLSDIVNRVRNAPDYRRAKMLAANDYKLIMDLVQLRKDRGLKQRDVAEKLGISQQAVSKLEHYDSDPKLSTLRLYANAIGALVGHHVEADSGQLADGSNWDVVSYVSPAPARPAHSAPGSYVPALKGQYHFALAA